MAVKRPYRLRYPDGERVVALTDWQRGHFERAAAHPGARLEAIEPVDADSGDGADDSEEG